jgi:hypothetical protein
VPRYRLSTAATIDGTDGRRKRQSPPDVAFVALQQKVIASSPPTMLCIETFDWILWIRPRKVAIVQSSILRLQGLGDGHMLLRLFDDQREAFRLRSRVERMRDEQAFYENHSGPLRLAWALARIAAVPLLLVALALLLPLVSLSS